MDLVRNNHWIMKIYKNFDILILQIISLKFLMMNLRTFK